jgi:hypothetical protein
MNPIAQSVAGFTSPRSSESSVPTKCHSHGIDWQHPTPQRTESVASSSSQPATTEFLGFTSYSSILAEHSTGLGLESQESNVGTPFNISLHHIKKGTEILALLIDMPLWERFIDRWFKLCPGVVVIEPMVRQWASELWQVHKKTLQSGKPDKLEELSVLVWQNTQSAVVFNRETTPREWVSKSTGVNLRWETVGTLFTIIGLLALTLMGKYTYQSIFHIIDPLIQYRR